MTTEISIVIPAKDEAESIPQLCQWIIRVMQKHGYTSYKILHRNYTMVPMSGFVYQVQFFK